MNILIPHKWLLEHLDTTAAPKKIQECLSLCGPSVERIETIKDDQIYDIEVTTNRVDSASVRGIAREAATILPEFSIAAELKTLDSSKLDKNNFSNLENLDLEIENDPALCDRIMAISMKVDEVKQSPQWLQDRLEQVGQRSLNALIDITNYVMWEMGHPIHVFDLDKIDTKKIIVRTAQKGEKLTTLDNKTHTLNGGEVVFDNGKGEIIDLPGIMGTANSVVSDQTKNILVWIESVPAKLIRQASMGLAIRTQAAVLNEKNVDPSLAEDTLLRAVKLYQEICQATPTSNIYDVWPNKWEIKNIEIEHRLIEEYLGLKIESDRVIRILENLGCQVSTVIKNNSDSVEVNTSSILYSVTPPTGRSHDLQIREDLIEEIARIFGYHNIPSVLMASAIPVVESNSNYQKEYLIKSYLANWGASEVYTYSLVSKDLAQISDKKLEKTIKLANPLTSDMTHLRTSLIPSHQLVFKENQQLKNWTIFEMANTYHPTDEGELPQERMDLVISSIGDYINLKSIIDNLFFSLNIDFEVLSTNNSESDDFDSSLVAVIKSDNEILGQVGKTVYGFYSCLINVETLIKKSLKNPKYVPLAKTSAIKEDLTFTFKDKVNLGPVIKQIMDLNPIIQLVELNTIYKNNYTFTISYLNRETQLTSADVSPIRNSVISLLQDSFNASLVGQV